MKEQKLSDRLEVSKIILTSEKDWIQYKLDDKIMKIAEDEASFQEKESKRLGLKDNAMDPDGSLSRTVASKQFEYALQQWGGGTARVTKPNEFHDYPDVGQVNARFVFDKEDGLMIMKKDQLLVPMVLGTGKPPIFYFMGWTIPAYAKYTIYKINVGREVPIVGFLGNMQDHEACTFSKQWLYPMWSFNLNLLK